MRAAIFARVSTAEQAQKGYSLPDQIATCRTRAVELGCSQIDEFIDDESGAFMDTPGLESLRDAIRNNNYKYVVMIDPDRLARNLTRQLVVASEIESAGSELVFTNYDYDKTPEGRLFFSIKGALSEYEREKIKERTSRGLRRKALSGKVPKSGRPYGYTYNPTEGMYDINEKEAEIVKLIYDWVGNEGATLYEVCRRLVSMGVPTKTNIGRWSTSTISSILHNSLYYGEAVAFRKSTKKVGPGEYVQGKHPKENWVTISVPAIITKELSEKAEESLRNNYLTSTRNTKIHHLLQGLVYCQVCGLRLGVCYNNRRTIAYFFCRTGTKSQNRVPRSPSCAVRMIPIHILDELIIKTIGNYVCYPDELKNYIQKDDMPSAKYNERDLSSSIDKLYVKIKKCSEERQKVIKLFRKNLITEEEVEKEIKEISTEESKIKHQIEKIEKKITNLKRNTGEVDHFTEKFISEMKSFDTESFDIKKKLLGTYIHKIYPRRIDNGTRSDSCLIEVGIEFKI